MATLSPCLDCPAGFCSLERKRKQANDSAFPSNLQTYSVFQFGSSKNIIPLTSSAKRANIALANSTYRPQNIRRPRPPQAAKRGFGGQKTTKPAPAKEEPTLISKPKPSSEPDSDFGPDADEDDNVPEVVTNRMLKRITLTVGIPIFFGICFFPFFYWLKVVQKVDVPEWLPLVVSTLFFGAGGLGISYGVISTSWDPNREGSLLGWREARANWPVLWSTLQKGK